jgi:hypothetical protein
MSLFDAFTETCEKCEQTMSLDQYFMHDCPKVKVYDVPAEDPGAVVEGKKTAIQILAEVYHERRRQDKLKAEGRFPFTCADAIVQDTKARGNDALKLAILMEEIGEASRAVCEVERLANDKHYDDAKKQLRKELVQCSAVILAWLESLS